MVDQTRRKSKSARAGILFPVTRIRKSLKEHSDKRVGDKASVYLAAVLQYLTAELIDVAHAVGKELKRRRISPRTIFLGKCGDEELQKVMKEVIIPGGGVLPDENKEVSKGSEQGKKDKKKQGKRGKK